MQSTSPSQHPILIYSSLALLCAAVVIAGWYIYEQRQTVSSLQADLTQKSIEIATAQNKLESASNTIARLESELEELNEEYEELEDDYRDERNQNEAFEDQLQDLGRTVGVLDKLANTDEELLRKYSRVSFLNENYIPESLSEIDDEWKYDESRDHELQTPVMPYFEDMMEDAAEDGVEMYVVSAYRSFDYQADLKQRYLVTYGTGANAFSADQGFSEHQLGTAVDFTAPGLGGGLNGFENTPAYEWLLDNAHKYGFVLSYPEGNAFYVFEPWHWRFVGEDLADDLYDDDAFFYDWEQREIDEYLVSIFD